MTFLSILIATFAGGVLSLIGAFLLARKGSWKDSFSLQLTAFASGVMLTTALLHLGPEAIHEGLAAESVFQVIFVAIVTLFALERLVFWFHHHHETHGPRPTAWLISVGDSVHNFLDGVAIAAAFLIDVRLGIVTTIAVSLHEIPQEIADFIILMRSGMTAKRAIMINVFSALMAMVGGVVTFFIRDAIDPYIGVIVAFSAGMFLYIALSDLIPELHHHSANTSEKWKQLGWFAFGVFLMLGVTNAVHGQLHADHGHLDEHHDDRYHTEEEEHLDDEEVVDENHREDE